MSKKTIENLTSASQFKKVKTPSGKTAFEAYAAIWFHYGEETAICSPTMDQLVDDWNKVTATDLNKEKAQHIWIVKANNA